MTFYEQSHSYQISAPFLVLCVDSAWSHQQLNGCLFIGCIIAQTQIQQLQGLGRIVLLPT
jgi:hypothetical protein